MVSSIARRTMCARLHQRQQGRQSRPKGHAVRCSYQSRWRHVASLSWGAQLCPPEMTRTTERSHHTRESPSHNFPAAVWNQFNNRAVVSCRGPAHGWPASTTSIHPELPYRGAGEERAYGYTILKREPCFQTPTNGSCLENAHGSIILSGSNGAGQIADPGPDGDDPAGDGAVMIKFQYGRASDVADAVRQIAADPTAKFIAGGTNLIDLMKEDVERPSRLIDISRLPLKTVEETAGGGLKIGALVP